MLSWLLPGVLRAQNFKIDVSSGLSNDFVLSLAIDKHGYVWAGTEDGLNRLAAGSCTAYKKSPQQRQGIRGNADKVISLRYDEQNDLLYVGTEGGLDVLRGSSGEQLKTTGDSLIRYGILDLTTDHQQGMWVIYASGHVQHVDGRTLKVTNLAIPRVEGGTRTALDDGQGHLYLGHTKGGLSIINLQNNEVTTRLVHEPGNAHSLPGDNVRRLIHDSRGAIWVGTDHGLALYNPTKQTFVKVVHRNSRFDDNVFDMCEMADGTLWVACDVGGISVVDLSEAHRRVSLSTIEHNGSVMATEQLYYVKDVSFGLSSLNTRCLLQDKYGGIWVGSHGAGIEYLSNRKPFLHVLPYTTSKGLRAVHAIAADAKGRLWVNSDDEISLWQNDSLVQRWTISGMRSRAHSFARSMMADSSGFLWLGMEDEGVVRFDTRTGRFESIDIGYDAPDIHGFFEDVDGSVWIGSECGVCIYRNGKVSHHETIDRLTRQAPAATIMRMSDHQMLVATQGNGLLLYNEQTADGIVLHMTDGLPSENINHAIADGEGGLWLATNEGIVHVDDWATLSGLTCYDVSQGLFENHVQAITLDSHDRLWASTFSAIASLGPVGKEQRPLFHNYSGYAHLHIGTFASGSVALTSDGHLAFGSSNGVCCLNPDNMNGQNESVMPKIALCQVYQTVNGETEVLNLLPESGARFTLNHNQNAIRLVATVDNYAQLGVVDFSYRMKGLDNKWYPVGNDQEVVFRGLPPGNYTFELRAKQKQQGWESAVLTKINLRIEPPFWQSWWAYLMYFLLAAGVAYYFFVQYKHRLALRNSLAMAKRESQQKQELNEERLRFFTNITHELRTPLTLILGPLDDLTIDPQLSDSSRKKVELINRSAKRLRDLINQILEFRKTETQNRRLTVARGDIEPFVREIVQNFKGLNRNSKVDIRYVASPDIPLVYFDSEVVTTVLTNLLSNAVKYTEQGNITVSVELREADRQLGISVSDTGHGIAADALPHIFDRYYQVKGSHQASGTGIGLSLVKSLADLHEAKLTVQSEEGHGSQFTLLFSLDNTYPNALHKEDAAPEQPLQELLDLAADSQYDAASSAQQADRNSSSEEPDDQPPLLLIVEDNADIRQYIADSLGDDYRILQAADGAEGVALATDQLPDLIVSDIMMPKMNGIQLTQQLKTDIRTSHIPIVLLTAKDADEDKEEGYDSGADSYLTKPFTAKLLSSRIKNLLTSRRRLAEMLGESGSPVHKTVAAVEESSADAQPLNQLSRLDREFMERLNQVIDSNIMKEDIDMSFLTDKMAMSHSTFYRKVKALTGLTAKEYVRRQRLRHCYTLLESGDYNVTEAATMVGFNQLTHFREVFKHEFGILPSEVKKKVSTE